MDECIVCGEEGANFRGTPRAERLVYYHRALWNLHKLRQALMPDSHAVADEVSDVIRRLEAVSDVLLDLDPNG